MGRRKKGSTDMQKTISGPKRGKIFSFAASFLCPAATFYLFDLYTHNPFVSMNLKTQLLNIAFFLLTEALLFGVLCTLRTALTIQSLLFMVIGLGNYYVLKFRAAPIMPWDIFSIETAAGVAGNFNYVPETGTILVLFGFAVLLLLESRVRMKMPRNIGVRLCFIFVPIVLLWGYAGMIQNDNFVRKFGLYDKLFTPEAMTRLDGNVVAFVMEMEYLDVEVPEGYSAQEAKEFYREQESEEYLRAIEDPEEFKRPNIIVIMDEAFSDLAVLGEVHSNEDYMPFFHSLQKGSENTVTGLLNVSVLGGNTANTEFEFLTGHSMRFLPQGSVPYQQYIETRQSSLVSYLKELGYGTIAVHPYNAVGWERDQVYPLLGFDRFLSLKNFYVGDEKLRSYISDSACVEKIIRLYEQKKENQPIFIFNVTMQNHSGYDTIYNNFTPDITVEGIHSVSLSQYLSLIKRSDEALEKLIGYFSQEKEDTMIVFFGDHQPAVSVSNPLLRACGIDPYTLTEEEILLKYKVPYLIWSNFDIREAQNKETSANYLAIDVLEECGLPLPPYQNYLKGIREEYPIVTGMQASDGKGRILSGSGLTEEEQEACRRALLPYQTLEYYMLFDKED